MCGGVGGRCKGGWRGVGARLGGWGGGGGSGQGPTERSIGYTSGGRSLKGNTDTFVPCVAILIYFFKDIAKNPHLCCLQGPQC